jgi:D-alanine--poly(phosphoribitol) ligase subunit 2
MGNHEEKEVRSTLADYVERTFLVCFGENGLETSSNLFEAGVVDSYGLVEMVCFIESQFGVSFSDEELLSPSLASVDGIAGLVSSKGRGGEAKAHGDAV